MINFVIAHHAEATPLIRQYKLKKINGKQPFPTFATEKHQLIISGTGKSNSAAATSWLASSEKFSQFATDGVWVNFGIAGHLNHSIGTLRCANKITEHTTGHVWFPVQIKSIIGSCQVLTTDNICHLYQPDCLHEMEACGFYRTALRFSTAELTQCVKIVSDNAEQPVDRIDKKQISELISDQLQIIDRYISYLDELAQETHPIDTSSAEALFYKRWQFTVTQEFQLQRLLQRYSILIGDPNAALTAETFPVSIKSASLALEILQGILSSVESMV